MKNSLWLWDKFNIKLCDNRTVFQFNTRLFITLSTKYCAHTMMKHPLNHWGCLIDSMSEMFGIKNKKVCWTKTQWCYWNPQKFTSKIKVMSEATVFEAELFAIDEALSQLLMRPWLIDFHSPQLIVLKIASAPADRDSCILSQHASISLHSLLSLIHICVTATIVLPLCKYYF